MSNNEKLIASITSFEGDNEERENSQQLLLDLGGFEGPIDVLLELAKQQKVDLIQISILELADQYLLWVRKLSLANVELAADYLVMAAWLAFMKSRLLLPETDGEEEPTGEEMASALRFQLKRLEKIRSLGFSLFDRSQLGQDFFVRGDPEDFGYLNNTTYDIELNDLILAYGEYSERRDIQVLRIQPSDLYSTQDAIGWFSRALVGNSSGWENFHGFLPTDKRSGIIGKSMLASAMTAMLQLTKDGKIDIQQRQNFSDIYIRPSDTK